MPMDSKRSAADSTNDNRPDNTPNKRRKRGRHAVACISCHRRKQKCDGGRPCFNCKRRSVALSCTYTDDDQSARPTTRVDAELPAVGQYLPHSPISEQQPGSQPASLNKERSDATDDAATALGANQAGSQPLHSSDAPDHPVGDLFRNRDAPSFFGSSYFGPQAAAKIIEAPAPDLSSGIRHQALASVSHSFRDEGGPFSQIWDLLGLLPRKKSAVDRITDCFLRELNWAIDAVHPASFRSKYDTFWSRKFGYDDFATIDLRWLALLFIILAYGVLLDCPRPKNQEVQREVQETSLRFFWASRRAIVIAPTFYGESTDLVRAGVLVTRYLIYTRRVPESWLTTSFAMRMAQAQGMHIDGERWRLPRKETETRRRLWSHLYMLDKTIALALGRPFAILDQQCLVKKASNVWLDDMSDEEATATQEAPVTEPTLSLYSALAHELAIIVGKIQEHCFGLFTVSYDTVLSLDQEIVEWEAKLPPYFKLQDPDTSKDNLLPFLTWNRLHLHSMYHFARVTLHRPYFLRQSITNRYRQSRDICISSACADLEMRLRYFSQPLNDRLKWTLGPHHLFNSALILGIIAVRDPHSRRSHAILEDLAAYCEMQRNDIWLNEFALSEVKIVELCIKKAKQLRTSAQNTSAAVPAYSGSSTTNPHLVEPIAAAHAGPDGTEQVNPTGISAFTSHPDYNTCEVTQNLPSSVGVVNSSAHPWSSMWGDPPFSLPEAVDLQQWEYVLNNITQDPTLF